MTTLTLERLDNGARCRFTEDQWSVAAALAGPEGLPEWARPLTDLQPADAEASSTETSITEAPTAQAPETEATPAGAEDADVPADDAKTPADDAETRSDADGSTHDTEAPTESGAAPGEAARPETVELDDALSEAVAMRSTAVIEIELRAVAGERGVLAMLWTDGRVGASLVRGVELRPQGGATASRLRPGVEVSAFGVDRLVDEAMRLVPPAENTVGATEAVVPKELSVALARALREGNGRVVDAIVADLGLESAPPVLDAVARSMDGSLTVVTRSVGSTRVSAGSWLRCDAGWVELAPAPQEMVRHTPRTGEQIAQTLLFDLAGRLDAALRGADGAAEAPEQGDDA